MAKLKLLIASSVVIFAAQPALADDSKASFGWLAVGTSYAIETGHFFWVGEFSGTATELGAKTVFDKSAWQCPGTYDIDNGKATGIAHGYCVVTISTGDKAYGSWQCQGGPPMSQKPCDGVFTFTSGIGKLVGIKGASHFQGHTVAVHPDGKSSGYTDFDLTFTIGQ